MLCCVQVCNFTSIDSISPDCLLLVVEATSAIGNVNIYDIYDVCITGGRRLEEKVCVCVCKHALAC